MKANQPSSQWSLQETSSGTVLADPAGRIIAVAPDNKIESSRNLQALVDRLNALGPGPGADPLPTEQLRHLAQLLEKLSTGPFSLPLDQMMRLTNDLLAWRDYVKTLADKIEIMLDDAPSR